MEILLQFSGGKDSLACLHKFRPLLDRVTVAFIDTGATYPHVLAFVEKTCADLGAKLKIIRPAEPIREYHHRLGIPADLVPVFNLAESQSFVRDARARVNSVIRCCSDMLWAPMEAFIAEHKPEYIVRGSKRSDSRVGVPHGHVEGGITYLSPLWDMTDADVFAYLKEIGAELPAHYGEIVDSLDCYLCPAHLTFGHGAAKIAYTKRQYPALWPELESNLAAMLGAVRGEMALIEAACSKE